MAHLWKLGYAAEDIIGNVFRVTKSMQMQEELKLDFIKVYLQNITTQMIIIIYKSIIICTSKHNGIIKKIISWLMLGYITDTLF